MCTISHEGEGAWLLSPSTTFAEILIRRSVHRDAEKLITSKFVFQNIWMGNYTLIWGIALLEIILISHSTSVLLLLAPRNRQVVSVDTVDSQ